MNIYMLRQHIDQIERLRVRQPSPLQSKDDIEEAIEYQISRIEGLIAEHRRGRAMTASRPLSVLENADTDMAVARFEQR